jgi:hypothetical protein
MSNQFHAAMVNGGRPVVPASGACPTLTAEVAEGTPATAAQATRDATTKRRMAIILSLLFPL